MSQGISFWFLKVWGTWNNDDSRGNINQVFKNKSMYEVSSWFIFHLSRCSKLNLLINNNNEKKSIHNKVKYLSKYKTLNRCLKLQMASTFTFQFLSYCYAWELISKLEHVVFHQLVLHNFCSQMNSLEILWKKAKH